MVWPSAFRVLFLIYCAEAGIFLILAPWSSGWDRQMVQLTAGAFGSLWFHPAFRGAVSGFGIVHLLWCAHDLDLWLAGRRRARSEPASAAADEEPS